MGKKWNALRSFGKMSGGGLVIVLTVSCSDSPAPEVQDGDASELTRFDQPNPSESQDTGVECDYDNECDDGAFCNGRETCFNGTCHTGSTPSCNDGIDCTEDHCSHVANNCVFSAPDLDGDGHFDASCLGPDDEMLGDDCDDEDPSRYPGNTEVCSADDPRHDEDCDATTIGHMDADIDGVIWDQCCNEADDGTSICGEDCDDDDYRRYPQHVEICDDIDNDCDGQVDVNTREVPWFPDADGDNFGDQGGDSIMSCAPIENYSLRPSDCDDSTAAIHIAAIETCDGLDNDCDGETDEDNVCACAPDGNARPCACSGTRTGIQICGGGTWGLCDCDECVDGVRDCVAGILPRVCDGGEWQFELACQGQFSECNEGECTCPGGGLDCPPPVAGVGGAPSGAGGNGGTSSGGGSGGVSSGGMGGAGAGGAVASLPPVVVNSTPMDPNAPAQPIVVPSVTFDQDINPATASVILEDVYGKQISGTVQVSGPTVKFLPISILDPGMQYRLRFPATLSTFSGGQLGLPYDHPFITECGITASLVIADSGKNLRHSRLAMSPNGQMVLMGEELTLSGSLSRTIALNWGGTGWGPVQEVSTSWPIDGWLHAVDDSDNVMALAWNGGTIDRYNRSFSTTWSAVDVSHSSPGSEPVAAMNGGGRAFYVYETNSMSLALTPRTGVGAYETAETLSTFGDVGRSAAISASGVGAFVTSVGGNTIKVWHSGTDLTTWLDEDIATSSKMPHVAIGTDDVLYVAYSKNFPSDTPKDQVLVQTYDGTWSSAIDVVATGNGDEFDPLIGVDAGGTVTVAFRKNNKLMVANWVPSAGPFDPPLEMTTPTMGVGQVGKYDLIVSEGGDAVLVWIQPGPLYDDLWGARLVAGTWTHPQRLEDRDVPIVDFDIAMDDSGNAFAAFQAQEMVGLETYTIELP